MIGVLRRGWQVVNGNALDLRSRLLSGLQGTELRHEVDLGSSVEALKLTLIRMGDVLESKRP
jgi:hypothetical protein